MLRYCARVRGVPDQLRGGVWIECGSGLLLTRSLGCVVDVDVCVCVDVGWMKEDVDVNSGM
jgi:hypothetical protein